MDDKGLDLVKLGEFLRLVRGPESRRELSDRTGLSQSHIQKIEEGRVQDLSVSTLRGLAEGYDVSIVKLLSVMADVDYARLAKLTVEDEPLRVELERLLGRRVIVEAELDPKVLVRLEALDAQVEKLASQVDRMGSLLVALSSLVVALQGGLEKHSGAPLTGGEKREEIGDLVRSLRS